MFGPQDSHRVAPCAGALPGVTLMWLKIQLLILTRLVYFLYMHTNIRILSIFGYFDMFIYQYM